MRRRAQAAEESLPPSFSQRAVQTAAEAQRQPGRLQGTTKAPLQRGKIIIPQFAAFVKHFLRSKADFRCFRGFCQFAAGFSGSARQSVSGFQIRYAGITAVKADFAYFPLFCRDDRPATRQPEQAGSAAERFRFPVFRRISALQSDIPQMIHRRRSRRA